MTKNEGLSDQLDNLEDETTFSQEIATILYQNKDDEDRDSHSWQAQLEDGSVLTIFMSRKLVGVLEKILGDWNINQITNASTYLFPIGEKVEDEYMIISAEGIKAAGISKMNNIENEKQTAPEKQEKRKLNEASDGDLAGLDSHIESQEIIEEAKVIETSLVTSPKPMIIPDASKLELSFENIKKYISTNANDQEIQMFLQLCINQGLNPFIKDAYLIKYGTARAQMVVSKDAFLKKAEALPDYQGFEAGIIIINTKAKAELKRREGSLKLSGETLIGGWAKVYRDGKKPFLAEVALDEYFAGGKNKKNLWDTKASTMIRKVALVQCLREAFPSSFQGMYDKTEIDTEK